MRPSYLILGLCVVATVLALAVGGSPDQAEQLSQARRDAGFTGETREMVLLVLAVGIGGFVAYLAMTRRL